MMSQMFGFMRATNKKYRNHVAGGGIYLDDLNAEDPEVAALYITPSSFRHGLHHPSTSNCANR